MIYTDLEEGTEINSFNILNFILRSLESHGSRTSLSEFM